MYCEVILSQKFPKSMGIFDYQIPDDLISKIQIGQLVYIPFRNSLKEGVIINIKKTAIVGKTIKTIHKIVNQNPILTPEQIQLAKWMAEYYFVSLGTIIKTMLPPVPKKKRELNKQVFNFANASHKSDDLNSKNILKSKQNQIFYLPQNPLEKFITISNLCLQTKRQILIILPTIKEIELLIKNLSKNLEKNVVVLNNSLNMTQYYDIWNKIINNQIKIIIGTKLALFSPLIKPGILILDQVSNQNHKQADQNPRYDSRKVIEKMAEIYNSKLIFINPTLTINSYQIALNKKLEVIDHNISRDNVRIIDMKQEKIKRNFSIFSDQLIISMTNKLNENGKIFLFINKRGSSSSVICKDCGQTLICDDCNQSLTYHDKEQNLYCHQCNKKFEMPPFCPNCNGPSFKFIGIGTQKVELEIKKLFGNIKIIRLDQDNKEVKDINKYQIIIGTEFVLPYLNWDKLSLIGIISADTLLYLPDYGAAERTWHMLHNLINVSATPVYIQTYNTENPVLRYLTINSEEFYKIELNERKELGYPPFLEIINLIYSNSDKNKCLKETKRIFHEINNINLSISIITPLNPFFKGKWRMYIIIKFDPKINTNAITEIIKKIPDNWIIDRNPNNLL